VSHLQRTVVTADDVGASQGRAPPARLGFLDEGLRSAPRARGQKGRRVRTELAGGQRRLPQST
jgi:hypothetical protein